MTTMCSTHFRRIASPTRVFPNTKSEFARLVFIRGVRRSLHPSLFPHARHIKSPSKDEINKLLMQWRHAGASSFSNKPRINVVIVGAGPSGFYTAKYLASSFLKQIAAGSEKAASSDQADRDSSSCSPLEPLIFSGIDIDIVERLPTPYGLVRYGVAPDHPEVKNVEKDFASVAERQAIDRSDQNDNHRQCTISYFGNVDVGHDISLQNLSSLYDIVVLSYGCQSDKNLGISGLDQQGVLTARQFVAWYNGHPEFGYVADIVRECLWPNGNADEKDAVSKARVVVIGNGNVALDCARVLVKGRQGLESTDTPSSVLDVLNGGVKTVTVVGRRGHVQGAFTIKELRELTKLKKEGYGASFHVRQDELDMGMTQSSMHELKGALGRPKTRIDALLKEAASAHSPNDDAPKTVELRLLMNPVEMKHKNQDVDGGRAIRVIFERTKLEGGPGEQQAIGTGEMEEIPADLVIVSVGYKGGPLEGMDDSIFDTRSGVITNSQGKVFGDNNLFVTGWIKRGPTGIIGTNITDAKETVASIIKYINSKRHQDLLECKINSPLIGRKGLINHLDLHGIKSVTWDQFLQIDEVERDRKRLRNDLQPREKTLSIEEMLACLR